MTGPVELTAEIQDCGCDYIIKVHVTQCNYFRGKQHTRGKHEYFKVLV